MIVCREGEAVFGECDGCGTYSELCAAYDDFHFIGYLCRDCFKEISEKKEAEDLE